MVDLGQEVLVGGRAPAALLADPGEHEQRMAMIGLFGREVIPRVRELLAATPEPDASLAAGGRS